MGNAFEEGRGSVDGTDRDDRRRMSEIEVAAAVKEGAAKGIPSSSSVVLVYDCGDVTGEAFVEGGECCVARLRLFAGGGRDQFGGSDSGASSAGGLMDRCRFEVVSISVVPLFEVSCRSFPVPNNAAFRSEPFRFLFFFFTIATAIALSWLGGPAAICTGVVAVPSSLDLKNGIRESERRPPERLRL